MLELVKKVMAEGGVDTTIITPLSVDRFGSLAKIFGFVTNLLIGIGWGLVFIMLALGFTQYVMSKGEKDATKNAQQWLTYAVIGGIGLLILGLIKGILAGLLGIDSGAIDVGGDIIPL